MDLLKREMERKKKSVQKAKRAVGGRRFFRHSELRRQVEEEGDKDEKEEDGRKHKRGDSDVVNDAGSKKARHEGDPKSSKAELGKNSEPATTVKFSAEEVTKKLRSLGHPIMLFGETAMDRLKRLRQALDEQRHVQASNEESAEFKLVKGHGIRNPFLEKDSESSEKVHDQSEVDHNTNKNSASAIEDKKEEDDNYLDENDPHKRVYKYFKGLCKSWEEDLNLRPESIKRSVAGRNETKTYKQCKDYIRPMFKLLKSRKIDPSMLHKLNKIVSFCLEEEFVKAHDTYIDISIGRAAWPIGVTMVGIHARTGRAKIESSNVAHVMNSELQRKYLTSVKRLLSFAQKQSSADPSKMVR